MSLFSPLKLGDYSLRNRVVMAPMTRSRADAQGVASPLATEYYGSRADAGLIISEGTGPSASGMGYPRTPGIFTPDQVAAWRGVTDAVHARGGRIFLQLMHVGRIAHSANRTSPDQPVAPSAIRAAGEMWTDSKGMQPFDLPRALESAEIPSVIGEYAEATRNALAANFDGVELHSASGYLPNQFLSPGVNKRDDAWGGSIENRIRFVQESSCRNDRRRRLAGKSRPQSPVRAWPLTTSGTTTRCRRISLSPVPFPGIVLPTCT